MSYEDEILFEYEKTYPEHKTTFPFTNAHQLTLKPKKIDWLIRDVLERGSMGLLFGKPSSGKSLFALDWGFCLAAGIEWHDHKISPCDVIYIAGEGHAGLARRLKALEQKYDIPAPENFLISEQPGDMSDPVNMALIAESIKNRSINPGLIIVDTMHRNMNGDENSSKDIATIIKNIDSFFKTTGAATLIVHHSGHKEVDRSRGSSSIRGAMDCEYGVTKDELNITLEHTKSKDFEPFHAKNFRLHVANLDWLDDDDKPLTSVYLTYEGEGESSAGRPKLTERDKEALSCLRNAIDLKGLVPDGPLKLAMGFETVLAGRKAVQLTTWREFFEAENSGMAKNSLRATFNRSKDRLIKAGVVGMDDGYVWIV